MKKLRCSGKFCQIAADKYRSEMEKRRKCGCEVSLSTSDFAARDRRANGESDPQTSVSAETSRFGEDIAKAHRALDRGNARRKVFEKHREKTDADNRVPPQEPKQAKLPGL